jgi:hypothetical protein
MIITYLIPIDDNIIIRGTLYYNAQNDWTPFIRKDFGTTCH